MSARAGRSTRHAGNAAFLKREFGLKVYAHRADSEVMAGSAKRVALG
ncbi:MAG: hypothetical protein JNJ54_03320 [Myxococcaceae bacterium]|nr:hypothetical protein [Myxococcaceae bacterium]